jgi:hypothetical protein
MNKPKKTLESPTHALREAKSVNEFFAVLRKDLERIRGSRFRRFQVIEVQMTHMALHFTLDTTRTLVGKFKAIASWINIAESHHRTIREIWDGYGLFETDDASFQGGAKDSIQCRSQVDLKHLPNLQKIYAKNAKIESSRAQVARMLNDADSVRIQEEMAKLQTQLDARRDKALLNFDRKHPQINIMTGKTQ